MHRLILAVCPLCLLLWIVPPSARADAVTSGNDDAPLTLVHYLTDPDPKTGKATERTYCADTGFLISAETSGGTVTISFNNRAAGSAGAQSGQVVLSAPVTGVGLRTGTLGTGDYEQTAPTAAPGKPGLSFTADGLNVDPATGSFQVLEAVYDDAGNLLKFAADFVEYPDDEPPAIRGEVRYNSSVPLPVVTPQVSVSAGAPYDTADGGQAGVFTIVRTGTMASPLVVNCQVNGRTAHGAFGPAETHTATIKAGKSRTRQTVVIPGGFTLLSGKLTTKLTILPPANGRYTLAGSGAASIKFYQGH